MGWVPDANALMFSWTLSGSGHGGPDQEDVFARVKSEMDTPCVSAMYDPKAPTKVSADASSHGLRAVLLQQTTQGYGVQLPTHPDQWRTLRHDMSKFKKKHWLSTGHARSYLHTSWAWQSSSRTTTNHLCLYWATPTLTTYHREYYASVSGWCNSATPSQPSSCNYQQVRNIWKSTTVHKCWTNCAARWSVLPSQDGQTSSRYSPIWALLGGTWTPHSFQRTAPTWEQGSHPQEDAYGDSLEASPWPPRHSKMSSASLYSSLVAKNLQWCGEICATVPAMLLVPSPS